MNLIKWNDATFKEKILRVKRMISVLERMSLHERRRHFNMEFWVEKSECGTIGCAAGHCALKPWFRKRGFGIEFFNRPDDGALNTRFTGLAPSDFFGSTLFDNVLTGAEFMGAGESPVKLHGRVVKKLKQYVDLLQAENKVALANAKFYAF